MVAKQELALKVLYTGDKYDLADIPTDMIKVPDDRYRSVQTDDSLKALATSMKTLGQTEEIGVKKREDMYVLIYGEARFSMLKELGHKTVRCKVWKVNDDNALLIELMENLARGRHDPRKLLPYMVKVMASKQYKNSELPALFGVNKSEISKLKVVADMREDLQELFLDRSVPVDVMYELRIIENDDAKVSALKLIVTSQYSKDAARHYIRHIVASLCDKCKKTGRERDDYAPLAFHAERWLCTDCAPKVKVAQRNSSTTAPGGQSVIFTGDTREPTTPVLFVCDNCGNESSSNLIKRPLCDPCLGKLSLLQGLAVKSLGKAYWEGTVSEFEKRVHELKW